VGDIPGSLPKESGLVAFDEDGWKDDFASPTALQEDWESGSATSSYGVLRNDENLSHRTPHPPLQCRSYRNHSWGRLDGFSGRW